MKFASFYFLSTREFLGKIDTHPYENINSRTGQRLCDDQDYEYIENFGPHSEHIHAFSFLCQVIVDANLLIIYFIETF